MRKIVMDAWKVETEDLMATRLPSFRRCPAKLPGEWPRMLKFVREVSPTVQQALAFRPLDEQFDAYAGWGIMGKSPFSAITQVATEGSLDKFDAGAAMAPTALIAGRSGPTFWSFWNPTDEIVDDPVKYAEQFTRYYTKELTPSEARELVRPPILSAISEIEIFCIPYLDRLVSILDGSSSDSYDGT